MAIPFLNHLDLRSVSELQNAILHKTTSGSASDIEGKIIYDTGTDTIKYYSGASGSGSWISLTGDTNTFRTVQADGSAIGSTETLNLIGGDVLLNHLPFLEISFIRSYSFCSTIG